MDDEVIIRGVREFKIETPSWAYGNSGTRFHTFPWPGAARNVWERIDDAALVNKLTHDLDARIVALSSFWVKKGVESAFFLFAKGYSVYLIAANTNRSQPVSSFTNRIGSLP